MLDNNGQIRETDSVGHKTQNKDKQFNKSLPRKQKTWTKRTPPKKGVELKFSLRIEHKIRFSSSLNLIEGHYFFIVFCMLLVNRIDTYHIACTTTLYWCLLFVGSRIETNLYFFLLSLQQWSIWEKLWISL
jgi:hypothetical protein